jgi:ornithine carbamoyltransferase
MANKSLVSVLKLTKKDVLSYILNATQMKKTATSCKFPNKTLINMFYEPSTRTSCSFQAAAIKLGCKVISLTDKVSSAEKGESLEDTIKTLNSYGDVIVLRHPLKGSSERAVNVSKIPIINAGDGNGEHPTQALLDIFTIYNELNSFNIDLDSEKRDKIVVTFLGDLKNSRTIHSLIHLLTLFPKMKFIYISPPSIEIPNEIVEKINSLPNCEQIVMDSLNEAISITDILYVTRIQKERFSNEREYYSVVLSKTHQEKYCVDKEVMLNAKEKMVIMHPLPRLTEISSELDNDPRAAYFKQVENGVYMRMAILESIFL